MYFSFYNIKANVETFNKRHTVLTFSNKCAIELDGKEIKNKIFTTVFITLELKGRKSINRYSIWNTKKLINTKRCA